MGIVSFAQNLEDVVLWRALGRVQHGFYIDVGANDPSVDSVTRAFYERGWHGINIEPLRSHYLDLVDQRPRDINLCCALGSEKGEIDIWECDVRGWATAAGDVINQLKSAGHAGQFVRVPLTTLTAVCELHAPTAVHFLKIDVEGQEENVLRGADFQRFRPWVVVVEATRPNSTESAYAKWEGLLTSASYVLAYADGLNRFYVANDQAWLMDSFKYPPNVFDQYSLASTVASDARVRELEVLQAATAQKELADRSTLQQKVETLQKRVFNAETRLIYVEERHTEDLVRVKQAEERAAQAEARAARADIRTARAEARVTLAEDAAAKAEAHALQADGLVSQASTAAAEAEHRRAEAERKAEAALRHVAALLASTSWQVTQPLRAARTRYIQLSAAFPALKRLVVQVLSLSPSLRSYVRRRLAPRRGTPLPDVFGTRPDMSTPSEGELPHHDDVSPRTQRIFHQLQQAILSRSH